MLKLEIVYMCLNHLNELSVSVTSASALDLERFMTAEMLHTCIEQIGLHSFKDSKQLNILSLVKFKCLNYIQLSKCESLEEVKTEWDIRGARTPTQIQIPVTEPQPYFQSLVKVYISGCSRLREITWLILAPNLRHFIVIDCHKMEEIIDEVKLKQVADMVGSLSLFAKLKSLYLQYLPELKSIYRNALPFMERERKSEFMERKSGGKSCIGRMNPLEMLFFPVSLQK